MKKPSRSKRSRLFSGQPGMLLVDEYIGIELPDAEGLLPPVRSESIEMPDSGLDDEDIEDSDEHEVLQLQQSAPRRLQVALPTAQLTSSFDALDPLGTPEPLALRRQNADEFPDPLVTEGNQPEPLRLALPAHAEAEASLVLAGAAPEDYDDDYADEWDDDEDLWDDDSDDSFSDSPSGASIRLTLDKETLDDLRNLEERRSFSEPTWAPRSTSTRFDDDISLFDESDEDDSAIFERRVASEPAPRDRGFVIGDNAPVPMNSFRFDPDDSDEAEPDYPRVAAVRIGVPDPFTPSPAPADPGRWDDEITDKGSRIRAAGLQAPEIAPVEPLQHIPEEEPTRIQERPVLPPPPQQRTRRPPPPVEEERGSPMIWVAALTILITVGGWATWQLIVGLTKNSSPEQVLTIPQSELEPGGMAPDGEEGVGEQTIGLPPMDMNSLDERLAPTQGQLNIISNLKSQVSVLPISDESGSNTETWIGSTPIDAHYLPDGVYEVRLVALSTGRAKRTRVRIDAGKVSKVELNF